MIKTDQREKITESCMVRTAGGAADTSVCLPGWNYEWQLKCL